MAPNLDFYEECTKRATTKKQKEDLEKVKKNVEHGYGYNKRDALIAIGEISKDRKRLNLDEVKKILKEKTQGNEVLIEFDKIAGAPDWHGGLGIETHIYYLNEEHTELIRCQFGNNFSYMKKNNDESWETLLLQ